MGHCFYRQVGPYASGPLFLLKYDKLERDWKASSLAQIVNYVLLKLCKEFCSYEKCGLGFVSTNSLECKYLFMSASAKLICIKCVRKVNN